MTGFMISKEQFDKDSEVKIYTKREIANAKQMIPKEGNSLADYPEYAKLFDYELSEPPINWIPEINGSFTPKNISKSANYQAYFKCLNGHQSYPKNISDKTKGYGCPICERAKKMIPRKGQSLADYPKYAELFDYELSTPPKNWIPEINGCFIPKNISKGANYQAYFKCLNGHQSYPKNINDKTKGSNCPICERAKRMVPKKGNSLADYPEHAKLFDYELSTPPKNWDFNINGDFIPENISKGANYQAYFKCPNGHTSYPMTINTKINGCGCKECAKLIVAAKIMIPKEGKSLADYPEHAELFDYKLSTPPKSWIPEINGLFIPKNISKGADYQAYFKCPNGHQSYPMRIINKTKGSGCPICSESYGNKLLVQIFKKHHFFAIREFKFPEFKYRMAYDGSIWDECHPILTALNSKDNLIIPKSLTYSPKILIEYDGRQHIEPVDYAGKGAEWAKKQFEKQKRRDWYKNEMFVKKGIPLLRIPPIYDPIKDADKIERLNENFAKFSFKETNKVCFLLI